MKKSATIFLQIVIVLIGIAALVLMIRFPLTEGRAARLDLFSIYADPFIAYGYLASIPFFVALYQAFKLLGYIGKNNVFSLELVLKPHSGATNSDFGLRRIGSASKYPDILRPPPRVSPSKSDFSARKQVLKQALSPVKALRTIKYCAITQSIFIVMAALYIRMSHSADDDPAGFIAVCIATTFISIIIAAVAAVFERTLQNAVEIKSENDLTV
jgi:hypothetical protein